MQRPVIHITEIHALLFEELIMTERRVLGRDEKQIQNEVQKLSNLVQTAIDNVSHALRNLDASLCDEIIVSDQTINELHLAIEQDCFATIATQQPVAIDLRVLASALHISIELERIGDYIAGIADTIRKIIKDTPMDSRNDVLDMLSNCKEMLRLAVQAYMNNDPDLAVTVAEKDVAIDKQQLQLSDHIIAQMRKDPAVVPFGSRLLWIVHSIERIGDRATNICEQVVYVHQGVVPNLNQSDSNQ